MRWQRRATQAPGAVERRAALQVQKAKVVTPQQLKPQPVAAVVGAMLLFKGAQLGHHLPGRQRAAGQPRRELAGVIQPGQAVARGFVAVRQFARQVLVQVRQRSGFAAVAGGRGVGKGRARVVQRRGINSCFNSIYCYIYSGSIDKIKRRFGCFP